MKTLSSAVERLVRGGLYGERWSGRREASSVRQQEEVRGTRSDNPRVPAVRRRLGSRRHCDRSCDREPGPNPWVAGGRLQRLLEPPRERLPAGRVDSTDYPVRRCRRGPLSASRRIRTWCARRISNGPDLTSANPANSLGDGIALTGHVQGEPEPDAKLADACVKLLISMS